MQGASIVPRQDIAFAPAVAIDVVGPGRDFKEQLQQRPVLQNQNFRMPVDRSAGAERMRLNRAEQLREGNLRLRAQVLAGKYKDEVFLPSVADRFARRFIQTRQIDFDDFRTQRAAERADLHRTVRSGAA